VTSTAIDDNCIVSGFRVGSVSGLQLVEQHATASADTDPTDPFTA